MRHASFLTQLLFCCALSVFEFASATSAQGLLDDLDPFAKTEDVIGQLESSLARMIKQFGATIDAETLKVLHRARAAVQSAKNATTGVQEDLFSELREERAAIVTSAATLLEDTRSVLEGSLTSINEAEKRLSDTLERVSRASKNPWILDYEPTLIIPEKQGNVTIVVHGKYLEHKDNFLAINAAKFNPIGRLPSKVTFSVPKDSFSFDDQGFATISIKLHHDVSTGVLFWKSVKTKESVFDLFVRSGGDRLGSYTIESNISVPANYLAEEHVLTSRDDVDLEECVFASNGEFFDEAYTGLKDLASFSVRAQFYSKFDDPPPPLPPIATISHNSPEKICVTFSGYGDKATLEVRKYYPETFKKFTTEGSISWLDDVTEEMPEGYRGFVAKVRFDVGELDGERAFTGPGRYGPLRILYDPESRTVTFRPSTNFR